MRSVYYREKSERNLALALSAAPDQSHSAGAAVEEPPTDVRSVLDAEDFNMDDMYLDLGVGD